MKQGKKLFLKTIALFDIFRVRFNISHITFIQLLERQRTRHIPVQIYNNLVKYTNSFFVKSVEGK
jgi:hypothetical protein